jgi:putative spermidine/putrescine transport system permease protein
MSTALGAGTPPVRYNTGLMIGWALLIPALMVNVAVFLWPILHLAVLAFHRTLPDGSVSPELSLATWSTLFKDTFYLDLLLRSLGVSLLITALTLICSYPIAYFVHHLRGLWRHVLMIAAISPLLVSLVVRSYGWLIILGDDGFVANGLRWFGLSNPPRLVFNTTGVVIGMVEILMPYTILALLAGFGRLDDTWEEAAGSLGAPPLMVFLEVTLPLTLPGIALGGLIGFVLAISSFVTPEWLGGGRVVLLSTEIYDQAVTTLDWPAAAMLSLLILTILGGAIGLYGRLVQRLA